MSIEVHALRMGTILSVGSWCIDALFGSSVRSHVCMCNLAEQEVSLDVTPVVHP